MSDEEEAPESNEESTASVDAAVPTETKEESTLETKQSLRDKFRLTKDEEILREIKPSIFAFVPMYILAIAILGIHLLFGWGSELEAGKDTGTIATILLWLLDIGTVGEIGFVMLMFLLTWWNRMMNGATSGKWSTILLMLITFTPIILRVDDIVAALFAPDRDTGWIPFNEFYYTFFGVMWSIIFVLATLFYQRSFHYAITNHRVIYTQHLFIAGDGRRILFDNISEIRTQRTMLGALLGFNTLITDTGNQLDLGEESMGVSGGAASGGGDGSIEGQITKSIFRRFFVFLTYQRSRKIDLPDPRHCFYCISDWKGVEELLNEMHQRHSSSGMLTDLKDQLLSDKN